LKRNLIVNILIITIVAGAAAFFVVLNNNRLFEQYSFVRDLRVSVFSKLSFFSTFISEIKTVNNLTRENLSLREEITKLLAQLAVQSDLRDQNEFLRQVAEIDIPHEYNLIDARVFNIDFTPEGHFALVNKGSESGVINDDIVITAAGVLLGRVYGTYNGYSRVELISNRDLKVTVRLLDKNITAISRGMLNEGLQLDFISQNDEIKEGERIVTNGNDLFPYGLIVGSIKRIGANDGNLFKNVVVEPELKNIPIDRVLILSK
jgi:rod shape-determining protein MreC